MRGKPKQNGDKPGKQRARPHFFGNNIAGRPAEIEISATLLQVGLTKLTETEVSATLRSHEHVKLVF